MVGATGETEATRREYSHCARAGSNLGGAFVRGFTDGAERSAAAGSRRRSNPRRRFGWRRHRDPRSGLARGAAGVERALHRHTVGGERGVERLAVTDGAVQPVGHHGEGCDERGSPSRGSSRNAAGVSSRSGSYPASIRHSV